MRVTDLIGKHILILGYGREGQAVERTLKQYDPKPHYAIIEKYPSEEPILFEEYDVIIKSPGIPFNDELTSHVSRLTSSTQIFFDTIAGSGTTVIGITGSKGKSTTASLIYEILKSGGKKVELIGNIGRPAIDYIEDCHAASPSEAPEERRREPDEARTMTFVMELSSYQLMNLTVSPQIAVLTSFFPEHLDYHGSLAAYKEAKTNIARHQKPEDTIFYPANSEDCTQMAETSPGTQIPFSVSDAPVKIEETKLIGDHNLSNIACAYRVSQMLSIPSDIAIAAIKAFQGLPHRLQMLGTFHGIEWVDDAISTTPESTIAALKALGNRVGTIILGGSDRGLDFGELGQAVADSQIGHVILFPGTGPRIQEAIIDAHRKGIEFHPVKSMEECVTIAKQVTKPGKICLLSTASPSYNMFKNFEEKGDLFATLARAVEG